MFLLQRRKGYTSIISRLVYTLIIIFVYSAIYQIRYPGVCLETVKSQSDIYFTSVLSSSTRPYMLANIIVNILSIMFNYFKRMKEDGASKRIYDFTNLLLMVFISITHSLVGATVLDKHVVGVSRNIFFFYYSAINLVSSLFVAWFNRQMMLNGIGYGVYIILMLQIINMFIITNNIHSVASVFSMLGFSNIVCLFIMFCITSLIERLIIYTPIYIMSSVSHKANDLAISRMEYKPSNANILANILSMQTINIFYVFSNWLYGQATNGIFYDLMKIGLINSLIFQLNNSKYTTFLVYIVYVMLLFIYNYVYSHINYINIGSPSSNLRKSLCHIPDVPLGNMVDKLVNKILLVCSFVSVIITLVIFFIPVVMRKLVGYSLSMSGTDVIIITSSFMYIIDFAKSVYFYNTYKFSGNVVVGKFDSVCHK